MFLIAVPLSLGIAVASGAPIMAGLIAGVVGAVVAGALGGAKLQVSGPAAGLTVIVADLVAQHGWKVTMLITLGAGLLQIVFGLTRVSRFTHAIPPAVVHGMLAGIGVTIALSQLNVLLGGKAQTGGVNSITALPEAVANLSWPAVILGGTVIAVMLAWPRLPKTPKAVPSALVAILIATGVSMAFPSVTRVKLDGNLLTALSLPELPDSHSIGPILIGMLTVALVASVESLLSAVAIERMKPGMRTDTDRELIGQGAANTVSGLIGGLPITGVIVRSAANVNAGAQTRASSILHGVWIFLFSVVLVGVIEKIPMAALAGLLIMMGVGLVKVADIRTARTHGELAVYAVTLIGVVVLNLLEGVLLGMVLAAILLLVRAVNSHPRVDSEADGGYAVTIDGAVSFSAIPRLSRELATIPPGRNVTVTLIADYLDHAAYDHVQAWKQRQEASGGTVTMVESRHESAADSPGPSYQPWSEWQTAHADCGHQHTPLLTGVAAYHHTVRGQVHPKVSGLATGQAPSAMLVTCADSRVVPHMITHSGPGDVFTVQNVGNLVDHPSTAAAVEFAVSHLNVPLVAVCGHSGCGAMKGLLSGATKSPGSLGSWLAASSSSLDVWQAGHPIAHAAAARGFDEVDQLAMVNVALQLDALRAQAPGIEVVGMFYDLATATVLVLDEDAQEFVVPDHDELLRGASLVSSD